MFTVAGPISSSTYITSRYSGFFVDVDGARRVFERVAEAGVDYDDVVETLEREGVQKFADSFAELLDGVRAKRGELVSA